MAKKKTTAKKKAETRKRDAARAAAKKSREAAEDAKQTGPEPAAEPEEVKLKKGLVSLREWNDERTAHWRDPESRQPQPNGIGCPKCGEELLDKTPHLMQGGNPPRFDMCCSSDECDFTGRRIG